MTTRVTTGRWLLSATRTFLTTPPISVWLGAREITFGKSRISRRGDVSLSVTRAGARCPSPLNVMMVEPSRRRLWTRSIAVAGTIVLDRTGAGSSRTAAGFIGAGAGAAGFDVMPLVAPRAGALAEGVNSTRIMLRALRTLYSDGPERSRWTRAISRPSAAFACSTRTPAIGP